MFSVFLFYFHIIIVTMNKSPSYREISVPSAVKQGVELAAASKIVCKHEWKKADKKLDCYVCRLCGAYSAYSVVKISLYSDEKLAEEIIEASHQYALAYNVAVDLATESLPFAVGTAALECEDWQAKKKLNELQPRKKTVKKYAITKGELWEELTELRDTDKRFRGNVIPQRSGMNAGLNAVLASYDRYAQARNSVSHVKQHNSEAEVHNQKLVSEYDKQKAENPDKKIKQPKIRKTKKAKKSDIEATEVDVYSPERLFIKKKDRTTKPIVLPIQEKAKYYRQHNAFKLPGVKTWLRPKRHLPEGIEIRNGVIVETTNHISKRTQPNQRKFSLHLTVRHLIPEPSGASENAIGIDMNITIPIATSEGEHIRLPEELHAMRREIVKWQRRKSKRRKGSRGWTEAKNMIAKLSKLLAARKKQFINETAQRHCQENTIIGLEDLNHKSMRKAAGGTRRNPGKNVAAKKGLNRELAFLSPGMIVAAYKRAAIKTGTQIVLANPKNSSNECSACGHVAKENRESQSVFRCKAKGCEHYSNADTNAARNILARAMDIISKERLAADTRTMSAGGSGQSPSRIDEPSQNLRHRQFSETGEAELTNTDLVEFSHL